MKRQLFTIVLIFITGLAVKAQMRDDLKDFIDQRVQEFDMIDPERKESLKELGDYLFSSIQNTNEAKLIIICTHNSRRSHMGQVFLSTAAEYYNVDNINVFSGGTEATAVHPNAIAALERAGYKVSTQGKDNPRVSVSAGKDLPTWLLFSKEYGNPQNPKEGFGAVMVCSDADKSCPVVKGAEFRVAAPYDDPRYFDETAAMEKEYDKTARIIAREMLFVVDFVKSRQIEEKELAK